jgi:hypothetical protein
MVQDELVSIPTGRVDTIAISGKTMTIQTECFARPAWRVETRVYVGGALKKVYTAELAELPAAGLQRAVTDYHESRMAEIVAALRGLAR